MSSETLSDRATPTVPPGSRDVYVGPRPFRTGETLYCREREADELAGLLISQRLVLVHSPSGAGKTSLIHAKIVPALQDEFLIPHYTAPDQPVPQPTVIRVNRTPEEADPPGSNRYLLSALESLELHRPADQRRPAAELAGLTFDAYLGELQKFLEQQPAARTVAIEEVTGSAFRPLLLVFDQFEELLTLDPTDQEAKWVFMRQVGQALRNEGRWALLGIREDFLGALEPYLPAIPTRLTATYRLDLLRAESASQAIEKPAQSAGVEYEDGLIERLISDLRQVKVQEPNGSLVPKAGPYIEPVQLQVVCQSLWEVKGDSPVITTAHLKKLGRGRGTGVDDVLAAYYAQRVVQAAAEGGVSQRLVRDWFGKQLISAQGVRRPVLVNEALATGLTPQCLQVLDKAFLIRRDNRSGAQWYELSHDRLVTPIRNDNAAWRTEHLNTFQRQAELWGEGGRSRDLLVSGTILEEGERWTATYQDALTEVERGYLEACRDAQTAADAERDAQLRRVRMMRYAVLGGVVLALVSAVAAILTTHWAIKARTQEQRALAQERRADTAAKKADTAAKEAERQRDAAKVAQDAAEAQKKEAEKQRERAEWQLYAGRINLAQTEWQYGTPSVAWHHLDACRWDLRGWEYDYLFTLFNKNQRSFKGHTGFVLSVAFSPDGKRIVSGSSDQTLKAWDATTGQETLTLKGHTGWVRSVAFSPDGKRIVSGSDDQTLKVWDATTGQETLTLKGHTGVVLSVAFSPDGKRIVSGSEDQTLKVWLLDRWLEKAGREDRAKAAKSTPD